MTLNKNPEEMLLFNSEIPLEQQNQKTRSLTCHLSIYAICQAAQLYIRGQLEHVETENLSIRDKGLTRIL